MLSSMSLFSRRKNSDDKALRAVLAPQVNPYLYSASASSSPALNTSMASSAVVHPPHSAPLPVHKTRSLTKAHPIVSGPAVEGAGLVFAPHLGRARTSDNPARDYGKAGMRKPLNGAGSLGFGRRTKSFDQPPPVEPYQEFPRVPPLRGPGSQSVSPALQQGSNLSSEPLVSVNYSRAGSMRHRVPLSAAGISRGHPTSYSLASSHSMYPASPPLSPESPLVSTGDSSAHGMHYSSEVCFVTDTRRFLLNHQRGSHTDTHCLGLGVSDCDVENQQPSHLSTAQTIPMSETKVAREARSRELAALTFEFEPQAFEPTQRPHQEDQKQSRHREFELIDAVKGKERELEFLRSNSHSYREQMAVMEQVLAQKDGELENARIRIYELGQHQTRDRNQPKMEMGVADMGRRLMEEIRRRERAEKLLAETISKAESNMQAVLIHEEGKKAETRAVEERIRNDMQQKSRDDLETILGEEEKRRADLNWLFGEKIENIEHLRREDQEEFHKRMTELKGHNERLERQIKDNAQEIEQNRQSIRMQKEANEELIEMTRKINTRLGEEKKKNRRLEEKINQITMDALNNVSGANREVVMLKNVIEDKDTDIKFFETELAAIRKEKKAMEEGCNGLETELEEVQKTLFDRSERVKDLEQENMEAAEKLEVYRKELDELKHADIAEQRTETSEVGDTAKLQDDIELYKKDVKVYRKDVKKRDHQIKDLKRSVAELGSLLESKTLETNVLQDALDVLVSPREGSLSPTDSSGSESTAPFREEIMSLEQKTRMYEKEYRAMYEDYEALKRKHNLFVSQQAMIIMEIDKKLARVRKEKDTIEAAAARQLKKMQHGFLQLSQTAVVGQLAGIGATAVARNYQEVALPFLPMRLGNISSPPKQSGSDLKRVGSKATTGMVQGLLSEEIFRADLPPVTEPVGVEAVGVVGEKKNSRGRAKLERGMSATSEPAPDEEIFEW